MKRIPLSLYMSCAPGGSTLRSCQAAFVILLLIASHGGHTMAAPTPKPSPNLTIESSSSLPGLRLQLSCEEPSGIFWDRDTLATQTAVLLSLRVHNDLPQKRSVGLAWRVTDAEGKVLLRKNTRFEVAGNGLVHRRELFNPPARGAYRLTVDGSSKRSGADDASHAELPFAVVSAPAPGFRPRSFFALDAPALVGSAELDFYQRIGARVLRSPLTPDVAGSAALDQQMRLRWDRSLATMAVLPLPPHAGENADLMGTRRIASLIARYPGIQTWEIVDPLGPEEMLNIARAARAARPGVVLLSASPDQGVLPVSSPEALDGATVAMPPLPGTHPAAFLRGLLTSNNRARAAGLQSFHARENPTLQTATPTSPTAAAGALVAEHVLSVMSGASGMSAALETGVSTKSPGAMAPQGPGSDGSLARAAAFAAMTRLLEDTSLHSDLYPSSPALWGALFKGRSASIAVLWTAREEERGRLSAQLPQAEVLDVYGNTLARSRGKTITVTLGPVPVYVVSRAPLYTTWRALRNANINGFRPLAAQALPFTQRITATSSASKLSLRVRLQNISIGTKSGTLHVTPPAGWTLAHDNLKFLLGPGESRVYQFAVAQAAPNADGTYPVVVTAQEKRGRWQWQQTLRTATATNVRRGYPLNVDGDLRDWNDAVWMEMKSSANAAVSARVALRWDGGRLYIAARVQESSLRPRGAGNSDYLFWRDYDALQIAFGTRDGPNSSPTRGPFHDTDYGFLLSPFAALSDGTIEGRLLRLSSPTVAFDSLRDRTRWGGVVPAARCVVRRLPERNLSIYEASLPLSAMPDLEPLRRANSDAPIRFSWILHNNEGAPLDWSEAASVFPWWGNTSSFAPAQNLYLAAQTPLGFTVNGPVDAGPSISSTPSTAPIRRKPLRRPPPMRRPQPPGDEVERLPPPPPYTAPMPPSMLPPAAPPPGRPLPPSIPGDR